MVGHNEQIAIYFYVLTVALTCPHSEKCTL